MNIESLPDPRTFAEKQYVFEGWKSLYLDHRGHRVLADAEGSGEFVILDAPTGTEVLVDGARCEFRHGRFRDVLTISSRNEGPSAIRIHPDFPKGRIEMFDQIGITFGWQLHAFKAINASIQNAGTPRLCCLGPYGWTQEIPPAAESIIIRKVYDRFHGRQRARVSVDGEPIGIWYAPEQNRLKRWGITDFWIRPQFIGPKSRIAIAVEPPGGTPLWDFAEHHIWAVYPETGV